MTLPKPSTCNVSNSFWIITIARATWERPYKVQKAFLKN